MSQIAYYPGCSLHGTAQEYDMSARAVLAQLGAELAEVPDWNCCGATAAHATDHMLGLSLPARNLAQAQELGRETVVVPCAACFNRLRAAEQVLASGDALAERLQRLVGFSYTGTARPRSMMSFLAEDLGPDLVRAAVRRPLRGLTVVAYYGCLLVRPAAVAGHDRPEDPQELDVLLEACGAAVQPWSYKTDCCGGALSVAKTDVVQGLVEELLSEAEAAGAELVVTACPMCLANLEMRRDKSRSNMPVVYITEILALAMGLDDVVQRCFGKHLVDPRPVLEPGRWSR